MEFQTGKGEEEGLGDDHLKSLTVKHTCENIRGFPGGISSNEPACQCRSFKRTWVRKFPWRRAWQPTPVFLPGESHGQRSLEGYSPQGHKESDTTEATQHARTNFEPLIICQALFQPFTFFISFNAHNNPTGVCTVISPLLFIRKQRRRKFVRVHSNTSNSQHDPHSNTEKSTVRFWVLSPFLILTKQRLRKAKITELERGRTEIPTQAYLTLKPQVWKKQPLILQKRKQAIGMC